MTSVPDRPADRAHGHPASDRVAERPAAGRRSSHPASGATGGRDGHGRAEEASFRSYYGRPVLKEPVWHEPNMPLYLFCGGMSGASSLLAAVAHLGRRSRLALAAKITAAATATAGAGLLITELGRPERFLNMLRVFKPTSPMSIGSWVLAAHGGLTTASAASAVTGLLPWAGTAATCAAAATGPIMATYTAALVADTAVPAWHEAHRELPFLFAGSAMASAGGMAMLTTPLSQAGPARRLAALGALSEVTAEALMERRLGMLAEPYRRGSAGRLLRAARVLAVTGGLLAAGQEITGRVGRAASALAALSLVAGSVCSRFAVLRAGRASAADPKYTIVPQRERADAVSGTA